MGDIGREKEDLQALRELLLKPVLDQNKARDKQLVQFVEQFGAKLTTRLRSLEEQVNRLAAEVNKRDSVISTVCEGIASLGQDLRMVTSRGERGHAASAPVETAPAESARSEHPPREAAKSEGTPAEPEPHDAASTESTPAEPVPDDAAKADSDWDEFLPQEGMEAEDNWPETSAQDAQQDQGDWDESPARETLRVVSDQPEPQAEETAEDESDQTERARLRKTIRREAVQAVLPSRGFG